MDYISITLNQHTDFCQRFWDFLNRNHLIYCCGRAYPGDDTLFFELSPGQGFMNRRIAQAKQKEDA